MAKLSFFELQNLFKDLLADHLYLTASGYGVGPIGDKAQREAKFKSERDLLENSFPEFLICSDWIDKLDATRRGTFPSRSSYSWKHDVEKDSGEYIPQGAFILAALAHGCEMTVADDGINVFLGFSLGLSARAALST